MAARLYHRTGGSIWSSAVGAGVKPMLRCIPQKVGEDEFLLVSVIRNRFLDR